MPKPPYALELLVLGRADLEPLLDLEELIDSQREAFVALASGTGHLAPRLLLPGKDGDVTFCYAARVSDQTGAVCKFGSVNPGISSIGLPTVSSVVIVQDPTTGRPLALLDGDAITVPRTAAASVLAARTLANPRVGVLAILGCGQQGRSHARAFAGVGLASEIRLWSPCADELQEAVGDLARELSVPVVGATSIPQAVAGAELIVTATTSADPVLAFELVDAGATILSVGSFAPGRREVDDDVVSASRVVVDDPETALHQAGPIIHGIQAEVLARADVTGLGDVLLGKPGRRSPTEVVYYNSVGLGIQDATAAWRAVNAARAQGLGRKLGL